MKNKNARVVSVNISRNKGTVKHQVEYIELDNKGVINDAHAGNWHRQVSLLGIESIKKFENEANRDISFGEFAENITTEGITLFKTSPLDKLIVGETELEITQIGKKCHGTSCAIYREVGNCVMPKEGIFARVIRHGKIKEGDPVIHLPKIYKIQVITLSDRAYRGEYEDLSGPKILQRVEDFFSGENHQTDTEHTIIPDEPEALRFLLLKAVQDETDIVFTTGGTGIGPRDITPDVVRDMIDKEIPGIMEAIRLKYGTQKPNALLSRGIAGVMGNTLVYTLPGSVKAVSEYLDEIFLTLNHLIYMLHGLDAH